MKRLAKLLILTLLLTSCGWVGIGSGRGPQDPIPTGTLTVQGSFSTLVSGKEVTGGVSIYRVDGAGSYIVRLESLVAPAENALQIRVIADGSTLSPNAALRSTRGTMNYSFNAGNLAVFQQVFVYSTANNQDYGLATLR